MVRLDCNEAEKLLVMDFDEGLDPDKKEVLESHVQDCPACIKVREELESLFHAIATDVPKDPGEEFWRRYDSTLAAAIREKGSSAGWWNFRWKMAGALLAAVLVFAAVFTSLYDFETTKIQDQKTAGRLVIQALEDVYGPASEDFFPAYRDMTVFAEARTPRGDDTELSWFEVEDESGLHWL